MSAAEEEEAAAVLVALAGVALLLSSEGFGGGGAATFVAGSTLAGALSARGASCIDWECTAKRLSSSNSASMCTAKRSSSRSRGENNSGSASFCGGAELSSTRPPNFSSAAVR